MSLKVPERDAKDSLSTYIPWEAWLEEHDCHITQQMNIFHVFDIKPIGSAYLSGEDIDHVQTTLNHLILRLLPGVSYSIHAKVDHSVEHILHTYTHYRGRNEKADVPGRQLCRDIIQITANHYRDAVKDGFPKRPGNKIRAVSMQLVVTVHNPKRSKRMSKGLKQFMDVLVPEPAANFFSPADAYLKLVEKEILRMKPTLKQTGEAILASFSEAGLAIERLGREAVENILYQYRNPTRSTATGLQTVRTNNNEFLRNQLSYDSLDELPKTGKPKALLIGDKAAIVTSMKVGPFETETGHLSKLLQHIDEGHITVNFTIQQSSKASRGLGIKKAAADLFSGVSDNADDMAEGIEIFKRQIGRGEACPVLYTIIDVRYYNPDNVDLDSERERILTQWQTLSGEGITETDYAKAIWMRSLPGCFNALDSWWDKRLQMSRSSDLANMFSTIWSWPGNWKGHMPMPDELYVSRKGELIPVSKWSNEAAHATVVGSTRTGKSFLINNKIAHDLSCDKTNVYLLDIGDSYGAFNTACGPEFAQQVYFDMDNPICFNPLYLPRHINSNSVRSKVKDAVMIIASMLIADERVDEVTAAQMSVLMKAAFITMTEAMEQGYEATMSEHFIPVLKDLEMSGVDGKILSETLSPFFGDGVYAAFFDGQMEFNTDKNFVIFELGKVKDDQYLMSPLFIVILSFLRSLFYDMPTDIRKMIYVDEAHNLMRKAASAQMISSFYSEGAKFNAWITTCTQNLFNYLDFPNGKNILGQANYGVVLSQDMEQTKSSKGDLGYSDLKLDAIGKIRKQEDRAYSEFLYTNAIGTADERGDYLRFYAPPVLKNLFGSNAEERALRQRLRAENPSMSLMEIAELMMEHTN